MREVGPGKTLDPKSEILEKNPQARRSRPLWQTESHMIHRQMSTATEACPKKTNHTVDLQ